MSLEDEKWFGLLLVWIMNPFANEFSLCIEKSFRGLSLKHGKSQTLFEIHKKKSKSWENESLSTRAECSE